MPPRNVRLVEVPVPDGDAEGEDLDEGRQRIVRLEPAIDFFSFVSDAAAAVAVPDFQGTLAEREGSVQLTSLY